MPPSERATADAASAPAPPPPPPARTVDALSASMTVKFPMPFSSVPHVVVGVRSASGIGYAFLIARLPVKHLGARMQVDGLRVDRARNCAFGTGIYCRRASYEVFLLIFCERLCGTRAREQPLYSTLRQPDCVSLCRRQQVAASEPLKLSQAVSFAVDRADVSARRFAVR